MLTTATEEALEYVEGIRMVLLASFMRFQTFLQNSQAS